MKRFGAEFVFIMVSVAIVSSATTFFGLGNRSASCEKECTKIGKIRQACKDLARCIGVPQSFNGSRDDICYLDIKAPDGSPRTGFYNEDLEAALGACDLVRRTEKK